MADRGPAFGILPPSHSATEVVLALVAAKGDGEPYPAGSAVVIGPGLALTADHVLDGFWQYFGGEEWMPAGFGIQASHYIAGRADPLIWHVTSAARTDTIDIAILGLTASANVPESYVPMVPALDFEPPTTGLEVQAFGFPLSEVERSPDGGWLIRHQAVGAKGRVGDVYQLRRDAGMLKFPSFAMDLPIEAGMSGGPVFDSAGYLRGIVSTSVKPHLVPSYASTLWPTLGLVDPRPGGSVMSLRGMVEAGLVGGIHYERYVPLVGPGGATVISAT